MSTPSRLTIGLLLLLAAINIGRGAAHAFLPDSGGGVIAGFDMTQGGQAITFLLASSGVAQLGQAVLCALAALRYREFAVPLLAVEAAKNWGASAMAFVFKPPPVDVPGKTGMAVAAVVLTAGLVWEFARPGRRV